MGNNAGEGTARQMGREARDTFDTAAKAADDLGRRAGEAGAAVRQAVLSQVESQPIASLVMAAALGLVFGLVVARR